MTDPATARAFLVGEVDGLGPHDYLSLRPSGRVFHTVEVVRRGDGALEVRVPGRAPGLEPLSKEKHTQLQELGFASEAPEDPTRVWSREIEGAEAAVDHALRLLAEVFAEKPDAPLDVVHGSRRDEHEARQKLEKIRPQVEAVVIDVLGEKPKQDDDGDYVLPIGDVHVTVAPRAIAGGPVVVRVFAITNVGVTVAPELGLLLARLNFGLMFGRFALDTEHQSIWFDEMLLGDQLNDEELKYAIDAVATTADEWDDRLKQLFGGATYQEVLRGRSEHRPPRTKPGEGGYL
ncbi:MAG: T3SS (YopN, CesT) and YbjN peptide-binding chaperone 1 [Myxococcota bacterium]